MARTQIEPAESFHLMTDFDPGGEFKTSGQRQALRSYSPLVMSKGKKAFKPAAGTCWCLPGPN